MEGLRVYPCLVLTGHRRRSFCTSQNPKESDPLETARNDALRPSYIHTPINVDIVGSVNIKN
jgi:hypothetical protein